MGIAKGIELRSNLFPLSLDLFVFLLQFAVPILTCNDSVLRGRVRILIDLRQRLGGFRILKVDKFRWEERLLVQGTPSDDIALIVGHDARFDHLLELLDDLLCHDQEPLSRPVQSPDLPRAGSSWIGFVRLLLQ